MSLERRDQRRRVRERERRDRMRLWRGKHQEGRSLKRMESGVRRR